MNGSPVYDSLLKIIVAFPVIIILIYISMKMSKKYLDKSTSKQNVKVLERVFLHNKSTINIVAIFDEYYVLGVTEQNISVIKKIEDENQINQLKNNQIHKMNQLNLSRFINAKKNGEIDE